MTPAVSVKTGSHTHRGSQLPEPSPARRWDSQGRHSRGGIRPPGEVGGSWLEDFPLSLSLEMWLLPAPGPGEPALPSLAAPLTQLPDPGWRTGGQEVWGKSGPGSPWQQGRQEPWACPSPYPAGHGEAASLSPTSSLPSFLSLLPEQVVSCTAPLPRLPLA